METSYNRKTKGFAAAGLVLTTMIWGSAFVIMKNSVDVIPPTWLLAFRFTVAAAALFAVFHKSCRRPSRESVSCGIVLGILLELAYLFQTYGLKYTTASKNAFITTLYVVMVPFFHWLINRKRPGTGNLLAAFIAVVGLALLSLEGEIGVQLGDILTLVCGVCFALHLIMIDRYTEVVDPVFLTVVQIAVAAVLNWCLAPILDGRFDFSVLADQSLLGGIVYLALFSTMLGFLLQNVGQKYLSANTSSILLSLESVFGALFSVIFLKESLTGKMLIGCALMFAAVLLSELRPGRQRTEAER